MRVCKERYGLKHVNRTFVKNHTVESVPKSEDRDGIISIVRCEKLINFYLKTEETRDSTFNMEIIINHKCYYIR